MFIVTRKIEAQSSSTGPQRSACFGLHNLSGCALADSAFKATVRNAAIFEEFLKNQERTVNVIDVEPQSRTQ